MTASGDFTCQQDTQVQNAANHPSLFINHLVLHVYSNWQLWCSYCRLASQIAPN